MRTASTMAIRVSLSAALVVVLSALLAAPASAGPRTMRYACASPQYGVNGVLHIVSSRAGCTGSRRIPIAFASDGPVHVCVKSPGGSTITRQSRPAHARGPIGLVRLVDDRALCAPPARPNETARALPHRSKATFCASRAHRSLRWVATLKQCSRREFGVILPRGARPSRARLSDQAAATDEDNPIRIKLPPTFSGSSSGRRVRLVSVAAAGAVGNVSRQSDDAIAYDPTGRFERLGGRDSEIDRFSFRASDGVHRVRVRVRVAVAGVNDAPVAADDAFATSEDAAVPAALDVIASAATAGSPGKDTDPEGQALAISTFDATGTNGGAITRRGDGTLGYEPHGNFESLGAGQTGIDTFRYTVKDPDGARSNEATGTITIGGENDSPVLGAVEESAAQIASGPPLAPATNRVTDRVTVSDVDRNPGLGGTLMNGATVQITGGLDPGHHDTLGFSPRNGIAGSYSPATGLLSLSGPAPASDYEAALRSVTFTTDEGAPTGDRTLSFRADDGATQGNLSSVVTRAVHVTNSQPSVTSSVDLIPAFSPSVSDYAMRCSGDPVSLSVVAPEGTDVAVDGRAPSSGEFSASVDLEPGQSFGFASSRGAHTETYHVRCLPIDFPNYEATVAGTPQSQWYFVSPSLNSGAGDYAVVFNADGVPVWWKKGGSPPLDFKLLSNGNVGFFSIWNGSPTTQFNEFQLDGTIVRETNTVGTPTDLHDYQELPNGNRLTLSYKLRDHVDVSAYTGQAQDMDAAVLDAVIQELAPDGSLVWEWNSKDHLGLGETGRWWTMGAQAAQTTTSDGRNLYDIIHINSVEPDGDGIVLSTRHTDAVYRIDRLTGDVTWKVGGTPRPESLAIVGDDFGAQHDARILPDGSLTLHDNGTYRNRPPRALRFTLDTTARTATLVESVSDPLAPTSICCGSARRLPGGNWVMSWGLNSLVTELSPSGDRPFKLTFGNGIFSYRANPVLPGVLSATSLRTGMDAQYPRP
jgi:VCBS repeat-containing protein